MTPLKLAVSKMAANCDESEEERARRLAQKWKQQQRAECSHHPMRSRSISLLADLPGYRPNNGVYNTDVGKSLKNKGRILL